MFACGVCVHVCLCMCVWLGATCLRIYVSNSQEHMGMLGVHGQFDGKADHAFNAFDVIETISCCGLGFV